LHAGCSSSSDVLQGERIEIEDDQIGQAVVKVSGVQSDCAIEQILSYLGGDDNAWFYRTQAGTELDLLIQHRGKRYGFEFKLSDAPTITRSMTVAMQDLELERLFVVFPGEGRHPLRDRIERTPLRELPQALSELG
jgi:hypothetical protein